MEYIQIVSTHPHFAKLGGLEEGVRAGATIGCGYDWASN